MPKPSEGATQNARRLRAELEARSRFEARARLEQGLDVSQLTGYCCDALIRSHDNSNREPVTDQEPDAASILERFRAQRSSAPLRRVRAWQAIREEVPVVSAQEVWNAWQRFKVAQAAALAGGSTDGLMELHDDWLRLSKLWLNAPSCLLVSD